ncbi:MAG TPA: YezD family protein [Nitrospira sp.]|nr:YezD family protein [Nitrospira sp.]
MNHTEPINTQNVTEVEQAIRTALNGIRYGSIEILIHDSKVVQIERKERVRFAFDRLRAHR